VRIGRQHVKDGVAFLKTEKSGYRTEVALPILPILQKTLDAGQTGDLAFICRANGQPLTKETFGNYFREAANAADAGQIMRCPHFTPRQQTGASLPVMPSKNSP